MVNRIGIIYNGRPHLRGGRGLVAIQTERTGDGGALLKADILIKDFFKNGEDTYKSFHYKLLSLKTEK